MSIRRNSSNNRFSLASLLVPGLVAALILLTNYLKNPGPRQPSVSPPSHSAAVNPLLRMLSEGSKPDAELAEGIAIGIAIDVSGSMKDAVTDSAGSSLSKIDIAQRCALDTLQKIAAFGDQHPGVKLEAGVFEFSSRGNRPSCRQVVPFGPVDADRAAGAIRRMYPDGGTPIGDAIVTVKQQMNGRRLRREHLLVITDGENNQGYDPTDVVNALSRIPDGRTSVYFFAFDIAAEKFDRVRDSGGLVMAASNGQELEQTLDYVLTGKVLVEQPEVPGSDG